MKLRALIVAAAALALPLGAAAGDTSPYMWTGAVDGNFANPANWSATIVPPSSGLTPALLFGNSPNPIVSLPSASDVQGIAFTGDFPHYYLGSASNRSAAL